MKLNVRFLQSRGWPVAVRPAARPHGLLSNTASCGKPTRRVRPPENDSIAPPTFPDVREIPKPESVCY
jgi:hypothetical protein